MPQKLSYPQKRSAATNQPSAQLRHIFFILAGILLITIIAYSNSINNKFTGWDDKDYITNNHYIRQLSLVNLKHYFTGNTVGMYQPLTDIVYAIEYHFAGLNPVVYHLTNILIHLINTLLVFFLIFSISGKVTVSSFVCLFFAIHPMHVESVTWLSELKDLLYSAFYLGGLLAYISYLKKDYRSKYLLITFFMFLFSLLSKSAAVTFPVIMVLLDYYLNKQGFSKSIVKKFPFFILSLVFGIISLITQRVNSSDYYLSLNALNAFDKFLLVCFNLVYYVSNLFFPFRLSALHPFPVKISGFLPIEYYLSPFIIAVIAWGLLRLSKVSKDYVFGILFFLITIILVIQIIPIGKAAVSERYSYLPYIGLLFILAQSYYLLQVHYRSLFDKISRYILLTGLLYAFLFFYLTMNQNPKWKDSIALWTNVIAKYPGSAFAYNARGYSFFTDNDNVNAIKDYNKAIELRQNYTDALFNRGTSRILDHDYKGAIDDFNKTLAIDSTYGDAFFNRGNAKFYGFQDNYGALEDFNKALRFIKNDYMLYYNLGNVKFAIGDYPGSLTAFNDAIRCKNYTQDSFYDNNDFLLFSNLGNVKFTLHDYRGALASFNEAIKLKNDYAEAWYNRACTKLLLEDYHGALEDFNRTLEINPDFSQPVFFSNRGYAKYKGFQDYHGALEDYDKAEKYIKNDCNLYFNRATVRSALKDFSGALTDYKISLKINPYYAISYFYLGNLEFLLNDITSACRDWNKSDKLGYREAGRTLIKYCR